MAALATQADLESRLGRSLTATEQTRAAVLLNDASARVRAYTRQDFDQVLADEIILRPVGTVLILPQRPVLAVTSIVAIGCDGQPDLTLSGWCWDGIDTIDLCPAVPVIDENTPADVVDTWWRLGGPDTYLATYDHGYTTIPDLIVGVVSTMVLRTLLAPSLVQGMVSEKIGQYTYQLQQSSGSPGVTVQMTKDDEADLDRGRFRRRARSIQTRAR
jgi:hypothetical protein